MSETTRPKFDGTITLGNMIQLFGLIVIALSAYQAIRTEVSVVNVRIEQMERQLMQVAQVITADARRETEILEIKRRLDGIDRALSKSP
jgi:hypothetical protein